MKAKPILMSAPMVRALLEDRKTQTRRIMKPWFGKSQLLNLKEHGDTQINYSGLENDPNSWGYPYAEDGAADIAIGDKYWANLFCPYGSAGDLLWVRESFCLPMDINTGKRDTAEYNATYSGKAFEGCWKPSIHMPRWASRLTLELISARVERLQDIPHEDVLAEGVDEKMASAIFQKQRGALVGEAYQYGYRTLWESINGAGSWDANPWVWVIEFKVHKQNVDQFLKERAA